MVEFTYNNSYQASLEMSLHEALYKRPCRSPLYWAEPDEHVMMAPQFIEKTIEKIRVIHDRLKAVQSRHKNYADLHRREV